jgi:hypothetical protein
MALLKVLEILSDEDRRFLHWFSNLRNSSAHNVHNVEFTFASWLASADAGKGKSVGESLKHGFAGKPMKFQGRQLTAEQFCEEQTGTAILTCAIHVMLAILVKKERADLRKTKQTIENQRLAKLDTQRESTPKESPPWRPQFANSPESV